MSRADLPPRAVHHVKRGRFRVAEPVPDHEQATRDLLASLPVHGLQATTVRELLHAMAFALSRLEYAARHAPDRPIGDRGLMLPWYATYVAQAKALLHAARVSREHWLTEGPELPPDLPVPQATVLTAEDCRARFLALVGDGVLIYALNPKLADSLSDAVRDRLTDAAGRLWDDLVQAGAVFTGPPVLPRCERIGDKP